MDEAGKGRTFGGRRRVAIAGIWLVLGLAGCATPPLYDENRDKQGQDAKKLVAEARIGEVVAKLEKTFADVAAMEEARAREQAALRFEQELVLVVRAPSLQSGGGEAREVRGWRTVIQLRLQELGMSDTSAAQVKAARALAPQLRARREALALSLVAFQGAVGHRFDNCQEIRAASADPDGGSEVPASAFLAGLDARRRTIALSQFPELVAQCQRVDDTLRRRRALFDGGAGLVAGAQGQLSRLQQDVADHEQRKREARRELDRANAEFRAVDAPSPEAARLKTLEARADRLKQHLARLDSAFGDAGAQVVAAEKLARLEALLGAIAGSAPDGAVKLDPDAQLAVAVVRDIPSLADEADRLLAAARKPRLVPFMAAIDQQKLVLAGLEAAQRSRRKQAEAVQAEVDALVGEGDSLVAILFALDAHGEWAGQSIGQLLAQLKGEQKAELLNVLALYADAIPQQRTESAVWKARARAAQYEAALARSKYAAAQWDALLETIATVLADYHASGIKKADLAEFLKALGLVGIGIGVAQ